MSYVHGIPPEDCLQRVHFDDSLNRARFLMSDQRSPSKNPLRGMLLRRNMTKQPARPKRLKRTKTGKKMSDQLLELLKDVCSESSLSADNSTSSSNAW
nr:ORF3 [Torque teno felis virus]QYD02271.1 ORF3 [Torque teno felis virus]QYD02280.1 ORF3 [Torque teno felis virus]